MEHVPEEQHLGMSDHHTSFQGPGQGQQARIMFRKQKLFISPSSMEID